MYHLHAAENAFQPKRRNWFMWWGKHLARIKQNTVAWRKATTETYLQPQSLRERSNTGVRCRSAEDNIPSCTKNINQLRSAKKTNFEVWITMLQLYNNIKVQNLSSKLNLEIIPGFQLCQNNLLVKQRVTRCIFTRLLLLMQIKNYFATLHTTLLIIQHQQISCSNSHPLFIKSYSDY
jgi:hypothetical protein